MASLRLFLIVFLLFSAICDVALACFAVRRASLPGARAFSALMAAIGCYSLGYAGELACTSLEAMQVWSRVQYIGIVLIAPLWIIVSLHYSGREHWLKMPVRASLFIIPSIILVLRVVPDLSHFIYRATWVVRSAPFPMFSFSPGPWYWVSVSYTNLALLAGTIFIGVKSRHISPVYRRQDLVMLLGSLFPWLAFLMYLAGLNPWAIDYVPFALSLSGPLYAWGVLSFRLFDLAPIARETLFDRMREPVLVFDHQDRFVDCNHAAAVFALEDRVGLPVEQALEHLPGLSAVVDCPEDGDEGQFWRDYRDGRFWQISVSRINQGKGAGQGRLVVLRDVTGLKRVEEALRRSDEQYRFVTENISDTIWQLDSEMRFVFVNIPAGVGANMHGYSREDLIGTSLLSLLTPEGIEEVSKRHAESMEKEARGEQSGASRYELQMRCKDGRYIWVETDVTPYRDENGIIIGHVGMTRDVSQRREAEDAIRKLSTIVEQSPVSIVITNHGGIIEYVNPSFLEQTGYAAEEILGETLRILKGGEQPAEFFEELLGCIQSGNVWRGEHHHRKKNGDRFWESVSISPIRNGQGEITHYATFMEDITEKKQLVEQLRQLAHYDALTGLPNRTLFFDRLNQALIMAVRGRYQMGLLYLDLDGFKEINDTYGHEAGDHILRNVAERLTSCLRLSDTVARMGGDEFTIILATLARRRDAGAVTKHIIEVLSQSFVLPDGISARLGVSIGIGIFPDDAENAEGLVNCADVAMYKAKRSGKNTYCYGGRGTKSISVNCP